MALAFRGLTGVHAKLPRGSKQVSDEEGYVLGLLSKSFAVCLIAENF